MKPRRPSSFLTTLKFFFESFFEGMQSVFKRLATVTGLIFAFGSAFGATLAYEKFFQGPSVALIEEKSSSPEPTTADVSSETPNRAPSSFSETQKPGERFSRGTTSAPSGAGGGGIWFSHSKENSPGTSPQNSNSLSKTGSQYNYRTDLGKSSVSSRNSPVRSSDVASSSSPAIPLIGILPTPTATPQPFNGSSRSANSASWSSPGMSRSLQGFAITSGGGLSRSSQLIVQAQVGEVVSPVIQKAPQIQIFNGLTAF